jgi:hypothetical protein
VFGERIEAPTLAGAGLILASILVGQAGQWIKARSAWKRQRASFKPDD